MNKLTILFLGTLFSTSIFTQNVDQLINQLEKEILPENQQQILFTDYEPLKAIVAEFERWNQGNEIKIAPEIRITPKQYISAEQPQYERVNELLDRLIKENPVAQYDRLLSIYIQYEERYLRDWFPFYIDNQEVFHFIGNLEAFSDVEEDQGSFDARKSIYHHLYIAREFDGLLHTLYAQNEFDRPEDLFAYYKTKYLNYFSKDKLKKQYLNDEIVQGYFVSNRLRYYFNKLDKKPYLPIIEPVAHQLHDQLINDLERINWTTEAQLTKSGQARPLEEQFVLYNLRKGYYDEIESEKIRNYCRSSYKQWVRAGLEHKLVYWIIDMEDEALLRFFLRKFLDYESFKTLRKDMDEIERSYLTHGIYKTNESFAQPIFKEELFSRVWKDCRNGDFHNISMLSLFPSDEVVQRLIELPDQYQMTSKDLQVRNYALKSILFNFEQDLKSDFSHVDDDYLSPETHHKLSELVQNMP